MLLPEHKMMDSDIFHRSRKERRGSWRDREEESEIELLFLWGCSLGMKCGRLRGTRADKRVQIGKSEQDPSHFYSSVLFPSAQSFYTPPQSILGCYTE